jgi:hypothetical protein
VDAQRFDNLTRALTVARSRRQVLRWLTGGLLGGTAGLLANRTPQPDSVEASQRCDSCSTMCWTNYQNELKSCRRDPVAAICIRAATQNWLRCLKDVCGTRPKPGCRDGTRCCGGICVEADCSGEEVFNEATCLCECPAGTDACYFGCAPFCPRCYPACPGGQARDPDNCDCACSGVSCPTGKVQNPDTCLCECATPCPAGQDQDPETCQCSCGDGSCADTCCDGACVDTGANPAHCGGCGFACPDGHSCVGGQCQCQVSCPPPKSPNPDNGCACECPSGTAECGGTCVDTQIDPANCGGCNIACAVGETCSNGVCLCGASTCGACRVCDNGDCRDCNVCETCQNGTCVPIAEGVPCGNWCCPPDNLRSFSGGTCCLVPSGNGGSICSPCS